MLPRSVRPFLLGAVLTTAVVAQTPSWSPEFAAPGLPGRVSAIHTFLGDLLAGGTWWAASGGMLRGLARWDGAQWRPIGTGVDLVAPAGFNSEPQVEAMATWNNALYFGGRFDRAGGQVHNSIARWDGTAFAPLGTGLRLSYGDAEVKALAVHGSWLYATGEFDSAGGLPVASLARWNGAAWQTVGTGLRNSLNGTIGIGRTLHVHNGLLYVGGDFDRAGGVVASNLAAWNGTSFAPVAGGSRHTVRALATYGSDLIAATQMDFASGQAMVERYDGTSWSPLGSGGPDLPVSALQTVGTELFCGGIFGQPGPSLGKFDGTAWRHIGGVGGVGTFVGALHAHAGEVIVGGVFSNAGTPPGRPGTVVSNSIAATDGNGQWRGLGAAMGFDRPLRKVVPWRGGWAGVGGFTEAGTLRANGLAFFDGDRWTLLGDFNGEVADAVVWQGELVVTGSFTRIDGQLYNGIARHDGSAWQFFTYTGQAGLCVHGNELFAAGGQAVRRWNGTTFVDVAPLSGIVSGLLSHRDGLLYLTTDNAFQHFVYTWNGTQATLIGTPNDFNAGLCSYGNDVVLAGRFTRINGVAANLMARWNGTAWSALPMVTGYQTQTFAELDGVLYAAVNGDPRGMTLRLVNSAWQPVGTPPMGVPTLLFPDRAAGTLWASGDWFQGAPLPMNNLGEWRTQPAWRNRLHGLAGGSGVPPVLSGRGSLQAGATVAWTVDGPALTGVLFGVGTARVDQALRGGILVPAPEAISFLLTDGQGRAALSLAFPPGIPPGSTFFSQAWLLDSSGPQGLTATNALQCTAP